MTLPHLLHVVFRNSSQMPYGSHTLAFLAFSATDYIALHCSAESAVAQNGMIQNTISGQRGSIASSQLIVDILFKMLLERSYVPDLLRLPQIQHLCQGLF